MIWVEMVKLLLSQGAESSSALTSLDDQRCTLRCGLYACMSIMTHLDKGLSRRSLPKLTKWIGAGSCASELRFWTLSKPDLRWLCPEVSAQACCLLIQQTMSDSRFIGVVGKEALAAHMVAKIIAVRLNGGMATCAAIATCAT
uniref:Uncharacterized protein n=1 Tax=Chrysotila carterae TaxID=13221 RepID=A0A7S4AZM9_CHRCT